MKKILIILGLIIIGFMISGCSTKTNVEPLSCGNYSSGQTYQNDCNTCTCTNGTIACTELACANTDLFKKINLTEILTEAEFNSNLTDYERYYLNYLKEEYLHSKIYHINTKVYPYSDKTYDLAYKKDLTVIKIKVLNGKKESETVVTDIHSVEIEVSNPLICKLFMGTWNNCPYTCDDLNNSDCTKVCLPAKCDIDTTKIVYLKENQECTFGKSDCGYGLSCYYQNSTTKTGICIKN